MPVRPRRSFALAAAVATAAALGATALATTTASAAEVPLSGYELTWGIKQSYRTYVSTYAQGAFTATDGAAQAADNGVFTFTDGTGTYDTTSHALHLTFKGTLTAKSTLHGFVREMSDFQYDSAAGTLTADLVSDGGTKQQDVTLAKVAAPTSQDLKDLGTTLTAAAGTFLGSDSYANAAGDPLSALKPASTTSPSPTPTPSTTPTQSPTPSATPTQSATPSATSSSSPSASPSDTVSEPATKGDIADGRLTWGVKESFRSYVVGSVAKGKITTSGGATQAAGNGVFTFTGATGNYDTDADTLTAAFDGAVNFKGHEDNGTYGLDLTFTDLKATLDGGTGKLTADVTSLGEKSEDVVLADLKAASADVTAKDDVITLDDVTTTLTAAGAKAFGGFYQSGAELDPLDLSVALTADATLPTDGASSTTGTGSSGTSGGTGGTDNSGTTGSTSGGVTGSTTGDVSGALASTGSEVPVAALGTAAAVTAAAGAGVVFAMRRRRTQA
ncbi:HtaA domain-containing protein [Streptomyces sp. NBC_01239]|uniref:HtaA domain-containing protein n=1 Tax=Streptomyces sp. NBC_01239 TaxID=2903792 RepID=UPI00224D287D|nr:HtaA domain-containing protein [Streptomyces sp. NBC_01239]MCX4810618.1 HtaA domain-containing protein [Streptomyces sp. NBC_01239]